MWALAAIPQCGCDFQHACDISQAWVWHSRSVGAVSLWRCQLSRPPHAAVNCPAPVSTSAHLPCYRAPFEALQAVRCLPVAYSKCLACGSRQQASGGVLIRRQVAPRWGPLAHLCMGSPAGTPLLVHPATGLQAAIGAERKDKA